MSSWWNDPEGKMQQIEGLPQAYMELHDGFGFVRFLYRTIRFSFTSNEAAGEFIERLMLEMKFHLKDEGVIIWRRRPTVENTSVYMRFATSPPLPESFWNKYESKEGEGTRNWEQL